MFEFLRQQAVLGALSLDELKGFIGSFITEEEYTKIESEVKHNG